MYNRRMDTDPSGFIHTLWDELADFDAARADESLKHLLTGLCQVANAQNAVWFGTIRMIDLLPDPVHGWRPRCFSFLHPSAPHEESAKQQSDNLDQGGVDITAIRNVDLAGTFRANRIVDLVSEEWFESDYYHRHYKQMGNADAIWAGIPVNEDAECYFGIFRDARHPRFTAEDRDLVAYTLRGLKWYCRRQMLSRGLMVASTPLTATERQVLDGLLTGLSEKQIAAARHQSAHTTHEYVTNIYRKFGVRNRAALMAFWMGKAS